MRSSVNTAWPLKMIQTGGLLSDCTKNSKAFFSYNPNISTFVAKYFFCLISFLKSVTVFSTIPKYGLLKLFSWSSIQFHFNRSYCYVSLSTAICLIRFYKTRANFLNSPFCVYDHCGNSYWVNSRRAESTSEYDNMLHLIMWTLSFSGGFVGILQNILRITET